MFAFASGPLFAGKVKVAFVGDQGVKPNSLAVMFLIKQEGADLLMVPGDFDYVDSPSIWENTMNLILGRNFPVIAVLGNHDMKRESGYQRVMEARLKRTKGVKCEGKAVHNSACTYKDLYFVMNLAPLTDEDHIGFTKKMLAKNSSPWKFCSWHVPHATMQIEDKDYDTPLELYEECRKAGAIIITGHSHTYSRTHLMSDFKKPTVASTSGNLEITKGKSFAVVSGLGGRSIRKQKRNDAWWAKAFGKGDSSDGALFCTFEGNKADCYFKDIRGKKRDKFTITNKTSGSPSAQNVSSSK